MISKQDIGACGMSAATSFSTNPSQNGSPAHDKNRVLLRGDEFIYLLPHPALGAYVANYTFTFPTPGFMSDQTTILSGASATLVMEYDAEGWHMTLLGPTTKPVLIGYDPSPIIITVDFRPAGLYVFTGIHQKELTDKSFPFGDVNPPLYKQLLEAAEKSSDLWALATAMDALLMANMFATCPEEIGFVMQNIMTCAGNTSVKKLAEDVHYSQRHLNRLFNQYVGTGVKSFARLIRMNAACHWLQNSQHSIEAVAERAGFGDPSHFVRDFEQLCGITPTTYRNNMSVFYNEIAMSLMYAEEVHK